MKKAKFYTRELLRKYPDYIFLFGDNDKRYGKGGQAIIRDEPNALGIRTKHAPNNMSSSFYSDNTLAENISKIDADINKAVATGKILVMPVDGIGTGRARLRYNAPLTLKYLVDRLSNL